MYLIKKILSPLLYPLPFSILIMICGLFLLWFTKRQRTGKIMVTAGVLLLIALSSGVVSNAILVPLERTFSPLTADQPSGALPLNRNLRWIVVLGGGHVADPLIPAASQISFTSLARLTEAVRIYRSLPGAKMLLTGGAFVDPAYEAAIYRNVAQTMGVPSRDLVVSGVARDTEEEARIIRKTVGKSPFILVTSALHLPRSVALFQSQGMNPVPAPAAHLVRARSGKTPENFYPSARELLKTQMAVHEYLGILWYRLKGRI